MDANKTLVLGIDPGFTGALALIEPGFITRLVEVIDMPLLKPSVFERKPRPGIDIPRLAGWIKGYAHRIQLCVVEKVSAAPEQGVVSMFRFGQGFGILQGVVACHGLRTLYPSPSVWKPAMNLNRNKTRSLEAARTVIGAERFLTRMKDHGRAEAILLALYGTRSLAKPTPTGTEFPRGGDISELF